MGLLGSLLAAGAVVGKLHVRSRHLKPLGPHGKVPKVCFPVLYILQAYWQRHML